MSNLWNIAGRVIFYTFVFFLIICILLPIFTILVRPFADESEFPQRGRMILPSFPLGKKLDDGSRDLFYYFRHSGNVVKYLKNSIIIALATTVLSIIIAAPAAFGFVRFRFPGRKFLLSSYFVFMMLPDLVYANSLYQMYDNWGLLNTYHGLILIHTMRAIPFVMFILMGIFESIPVTLEEASYTLGYSRLSTLWKVTLPIALPGVSAGAIFAFLRSWDEYVLTMYLGGENTYTIVILASNLLGDTSMDLNAACAVSLIMLIPVMIFIYFIQKYIKAGYLSGGMARTY